MKEKNLEVTLLLDFYGEVLTEKQREVIEYYYDDDLSLAEIAEHANITRQGVRDCIKRGEATLFFMEERLGLAERFKRLEESLSSIRDDAAKILELNERFCVSGRITDYAKRILETADRIEAE